jgi:hypothetical protein
MNMRRTWTDDDLRAAIEASETWKGVCDRLGLTPGGSTRTLLRRRAGELGLATEHVGNLPGGTCTRRWTDEQLIEAVAEAHNLRGVFEYLGLKVGGGAWVSMKEHIRRVEADTGHWDAAARAVLGPFPGSRVPPPRWSDEEVREAYDGARSLADVMRRIGLDPTRNRGRRALQRRLDALGLETDVLPGKGWARGTSPDRRHLRRPLQEILVRDSTYLTTSTLKARLLDEGLLAAVCSACGISTWRDRPLTLHLDHVNGDRRDNRPPNLRLLCPNCHSQTSTYCGRNRADR